jgi:glutaredoxin
MEFDKAVEMGLKVAVLEATGNALKIDFIDIESDELRHKRQKFIKKVQQHTSPELFVDDIDLAVKLPGVVYQLVKNEPLVEQSHVFGENEVEEIFKMADKGVKSKIDAIEELLMFTAQKFSHLFNFGAVSEKLDIHPFFSELRDKLDPIIPGISLDEENGILTRANIRHVIFRVETAIAILKELDKQTLVNLGKSIGINAASDLVNNVMKPAKVPDSPEALVKLWNYWDGTGGWGKIELRTSNESSDTNIWHISITNSFLTVKNDLEKTHQLTEFWQGYLEGFLNTSLPNITNITLNDLDQAERKSIRLPEFIKVKNVRKIPDKDIDLDIFEIEFKLSPESNAVKQLNNAKRILSNDNGDDLVSVITLIQSAIEDFRQIITEVEFLKIIDAASKQVDSHGFDVIIKNERLPKDMSIDKTKDIINCVEKIIDEYRKRNL